MSRRYEITIQVELPDESIASEAGSWLMCALEVGYQPKLMSEHPFKPTFLKCVEVAQPRPRNEEPPQRRKKFGKGE